MAITFANLSDLFSTHWSIVLLIALVFFIVQIGLCISLFVRLRKQTRVLRTLFEHLEQGGDGRRNIDALSAHFAWLRWVNKVFPADTTTPGNYTRDDVLQELDTRIASSSDYLLLQRMGVMAPLLGVILTVLGFAWLEVPESTEQSLGDILFAVTPLVAGVGAGAVLAFINQGLLHVAGNKSESLRIMARTWFDAAIWSSVGLDTQAATVKAIHAIERMAESVSSSAAEQTRNTQLLAETTAAIRQAGQQLQESVGSFSGELQGLPATLAGLQTTTAATTEALQNLIPVGQRAIAGLDVAVSAFRSAVESDFVQAANLHREVVDGVAQTVGSLSETSKQLQANTATMQDTVAAQGTTMQSLNASLQDRVLPAHEKLEATVAALAEKVALFRRDVATLSQSTAAVSKEFSAVSDGIQPAVESFDQTAAAHRASADLLQDGSRQLHRATEVLAAGTEKIEALLNQQLESGQQVGPAQQSMLTAMQQISAAGKRLQETIEQDLAASQTAMHDAVASFADSANRLAEFAKTIEPSTRNLGALDETLGSLKSTVAAINDFSQAAGQIERLSESLSKAAAVSEAIGELPGQIRELLEEIVAAENKRRHPRGALRNWLSRGH